MLSIQSYFWPMVYACLGGSIIVIGLLLETFAEKERFKNIGSLRFWESAKKWGEWLVILGVAFEVVVAGFTAKAEWEMSPLNRPIRTVAVDAHILVKGDKWTRQPPKFDDFWIAGISFCSGTNVPLFSLSANSSDVQMVNILGTVQKNRTDLEYNITFHQNHFSQDFMKDWGVGKPVRLVNNVNSFVMTMTSDFDKLDPLHMATNTEIISGTIELTVNSSMTWEFQIPPQKQKFGVITGVMTNNVAHQIVWAVKPIHLMDCTGKDVGDYDGK